MSELAPQSTPSVDAERRSRSLRALGIALVLTPLLVIAEPIRTIVSVEATAIAAGIGVVAGVALLLTLDHLEVRSRNDVRTAVVALVASVGVTGTLRLVLPRELFQTAPQFALAVLWSFALASVTRDVLWPTVADSVRA